MFKREKESPQARYQRLIERAVSVQTRARESLGDNAQDLKTAEECSELAAAINKVAYKRAVRTKVGVCDEIHVGEELSQVLMLTLGMLAAHGDAGLHQFEKTIDEFERRLETEGAAEVE